MEKNKQSVYFLPLEGQMIPVSKEVYIEFYKLKEHEVYLEKKDKKHGLLKYDSWRNEIVDGVECIADPGADTEQLALSNLMIEQLMGCLHLLEKSELAILIAIFWQGKTETEVSKLLGITQQAVHKRKKQVLKYLYTLLEKNF